MSETVVWQQTYDGMRPEQLDQDWIERCGGVEAYVFDGDELAERGRWHVLEDGLRRAWDLGAHRLTLHFPTDNADWVGDEDMFTTLLRFCELAAEHAATGVVLHANQFVAQEDWLSYDLGAARELVVARLAELDSRLRGAPLWIGVENLPIIGSAGIDYDSIFVYPDDFRAVAELNPSLLGSTWDLCHWAVTYTTRAAIAQLRQETTELTALDLPPLPVKHIHFGSFSGHAMPYWPGSCFEGAAPQDGDLEGDVLAAMLRNAVEQAGHDVGVVLEIQEEDYLRRRSSWRTLEWVRSRPELARLGDTRRIDRA